MERVYVVGVSMTPFGKFLDKSVRDLTRKAGADALRDANCEAGQIPDGLVEKFSKRRHRNAGHINTFRRRLLPPNLGVILTQNCSTNVSGIA